MGMGFGLCSGAVRMSSAALLQRYPLWKEEGFMVKRFRLVSDYIELVKLLKYMDLCDSGGMAKTVISDGLVKVDGNVELRKGCKIRRGQTVEFEGNSIRVE